MGLCFVPSFFFCFFRLFFLIHGPFVSGRVCSLNRGPDMGTLTSLRFSSHSCLYGVFSYTF